MKFSINFILELAIKQFVFTLSVATRQLDEKCNSSTRRGSSGFIQHETVRIMLLLFTCHLAVRHNFHPRIYTKALFALFIPPAPPLLNQHSLQFSVLRNSLHPRTICFSFFFVDSSAHVNEKRVAAERIFYAILPSDTNF